MKQVVDIEDLFWFVERYRKYYEEHNRKYYIDPAGLHYAIQKTYNNERIFYK